MKPELSPRRCENGCPNAKPAPRWIKYLAGTNLQCVIPGKKVRDLTDERLRLINQVGCASYPLPQSDLEKLLETILQNVKSVDTTGECVHPANCPYGEDSCAYCIVEYVIKSIQLEQKEKESKTIRLLCPTCGSTQILSEEMWLLSGLKRLCRNGCGEMHEQEQKEDH